MNTLTNITNVTNTIHKQSEKALISVIIPVHNRIEPLQRAVRSVLKQTFQKLELIIVDDGSREAVRDLCLTLSREDQRVRILTNDIREGVSAARNRGIRAAVGEYIALLDSDDAWDVAKLARQMAFLEANPHFRICHTDEIWIRNGVRVNPRKKHAKPAGRIFIASLPLCAVSPSALLAETSLFLEHGLFDEDLPVCEDYDLWLRLAAREAFGLLPEPLVIKNGGHPDQLSRAYWGMDRFRIIALLKIAEGPLAGELGREERKALHTMIARKAGIMASGARKRENALLAALYGALTERYS